MWEIFAGYLEAAPHFEVRDELPQWIMSPRAAYHPASRTIWLTRPIRPLVVLHELTHWLFDIARIDAGHRWLDRRK